MAKIIKRLPSGALLTEAEEFDPIYSEGWTIGPVTPLSGSTKSRKTPDTVSEEEGDLKEGEAM